MVSEKPSANSPMEGAGRMAEFGVEELEHLEDRLSELSERRAALARRLLAEIEELRREARDQGKNIVVRNAAQLLEKLQGTNTPMFTTLGWGLGAHSPGTFDFHVTYINPDPVFYPSVYVHVFVGPALLSADVGQALALVDTRFPTLTKPAYMGIVLRAGDSGRLDFSLPVPKGIPQTNYLGNCFLFNCNYFGMGDYLDRSQFVFDVT
jgi:hypothetical protein